LGSETGVKIKHRLTCYVLIAVLAFVLLPFLGLPSFTFTFFFQCLMYITLAESWNILGGFTGYNSFGHGVFFGIGAYTSALLLRDYALSPFLTAPIAGLVGSIVALITAYPLLRLASIYFSLATFSMNWVFLLLTLLLPFTGGPEGIMLRSPPFNPFMTEIIFYEAMLIVALATIFTTYKIPRLKFGIGVISIRENEEAARVLGVPTTKLKLITYAISAFPPAVVGSLYAYFTLYIDPYTVFSFSITFAIIGTAYLGGIGTTLGPVIGAVIFVFLSENLRYVVGVAYEGLHMIIFCSILILILLFMPEGILGWLKKKLPGYEL